MELIDGIHAEEGHIFAEHERGVIRMILLLEDNLVAQLFAQPSDILWICEPIHVPRKQDSWHIVVLNRNAGWRALPIELHILLPTVVVELKSVIVNHLGIEVEVPPRRA